MSCNKQNFSKTSEELISLKFIQELQSKNVDILAKDIISALKDKNFSVDIESSDDPDGYIESINNLTDTIRDTIKESNKLKFELTTQKLSTLKRKLKEQLLPPKKTKTDLKVEAIIPSQGMISQDKVKQLKFNDVLTDIFGDDIVIRETGETEFKNKLLTLTIIDTDTGIIIDSISTLNDRLKRFKADEYLKLKRFVETIKDNKGESFDSELIPNSYYYGDDAKSEIDNVYNIMYNYIQYLKDNDQLKTIIKRSWISKINGKNDQDSLFFNALNAYINLQFFDVRLKNSFGKYIKINRKYKEPITLDKYNKKIYKYTLTTGNTEMIKGWETSDYQDAIDQMSGYSQILIESIPLIDYYTHDKIKIAKFQQLNTVYFINAFISLRSAIINTSEAYDLQTLLTETVNNPNKWITILDKIFKSNSTINNLLKAKSLNDKPYLNKFDINVLYSVYQQAFNKSNSKSYYSIEQRYLKTAGTGKCYPIVGTLLGIINSVAEMNYLERVYDKNAEVPGYKLKIKRKFNSNTSIFDMINAVNKDTYKRTDKEILIQQYNINSDDREKVVTVTINNIPISINFSTHILDKKSAVKFIKNEEYPFIDESGNFSIKLSSQEVINDILYTDKYKTLLDMLSFIDNMLGTNFSKDSDGIVELREFINQGGHFRSLFGAAVRALKVCEIYSKIEQDSNYQKTEIVKYLEENPEIYKQKFWTRDNIKSFINKDKRGAFLTVLGSSEIWIDKLVTTRMIINGSTSKAVTKNANGDSLPNYSPTYTGAVLTAYLQDAKIEADASSNLLFVKDDNKSAIKSIVADTEIVMRGGNVKSVKAMSENELLQHAIIDKFYLSLLNNRDTVIVQPTTYSDKTKYLNYEVSLSDLGINIYSKKVAEDCTQLLYNSVGSYYRKIWNNILDDYEKIFNTRDILKIEHNLNNIIELYKKLFPKEPSNISTEQAFTRIANSKGVTIFKDVHYRPGKVLSINELLYHYGEELYSSVDNLKKRLNIERVQFLNDLIRTRTNFYVTRTSDRKINYQDAVGNFISKLPIDQQSYESKWIKGNRLIYAKATKDGKTRDIEFELINIDPDETIELNPFLEAYFSTDVLLSNNLRFSLTGSEINHKVKSSLNITNVLDQETLNLFGFNSKTTAVDALINLKSIANNNLETKERRIKAQNAQNIIENKLLYSREAEGQGAQLKRNVIAPATMHPYLQNQINGVPPKMRIAVIDDVQAPVQNFDGSSCYDKKTKKYATQYVDAHDGFAYINPIISILENYSLQDNEVGDMKKNILHGYDHRTGCAILLKYAAGAMTNAWMRDSELSPISLRNMFKKMSNERWSKRYADGTIEWLLTDNGTQSGIIDLTTSDYKDDESLNFKEDILHGKELFYNNKGTMKAIINFVKDGQDYYTLEWNVSSNGKPEKDSVATRVYHYFDNESNHITQTTPIINKFEKVIDKNGNAKIIEKYHTIDSIYELYIALGGLESLEKVENTLQESEASLYATAAFVNYVANKKEGVPENAEISQQNYDQPLKRAFIGYLVNNTAIKNGAGNQNPSSSFYDNTALRSITIDTKGHGVQLDADHTADEAVMTEFSQVITSLDAGGRMHNYIRQIYNVLGQVALSLSNVELDSIEAFKKSEGNKSKIYDLIGRTIIKNIKDGQKGLSSTILNEIKKVFNLNSDHDLDTIKIPFDDPNIYSQILSTFVSIINRKSIKRQYPGSGMVMMPGYDVETVFDYNNTTYQYSDLVKLARFTISDEEKASIQASNISNYNRKLVQKLLDIEQSKYTPTQRYDWVNPADRINIFINGEFIKKDISLTTIDDYYRFKSNDNRNFILEKLTGFKLQETTNVEQGTQYLLSKDNILTSFILTSEGTLLSSDTDTNFNLIANILVGRLEFQKNVTKARNLAPVKIYWSIPDNSIMNIFDHWSIKSLYTTGQRNKKAIQRAFDKLNEGIYENGYIDPKTGQAYYYTERLNEAGQVIGFTKTNIDTKEIVSFDGNIDLDTNQEIKFGTVKLDKNKIISTKAECIVPNIFQSKFGQTSNQSLVDITKGLFILEFNQMSVENGDIMFTKVNKRNTYISFRPINSISFASEEIIPWEDTIVEDIENPVDDIVQKVFAVNKDNIKLFEVARRRIINTVKYNIEKDKFVDLDGNILKDQDKYTRYGNQVVETITFIQRRKVEETTKHQTNRYTLYNIDYEALNEVYIPDTKHTLDDFVGRIMSDIYNVDEYNGVQLNTEMQTRSANILRKSITSFAKNQQHNSALYKLLVGDETNKENKCLKDLLNAAKGFKSKVFTINPRINNRLLNIYYSNLSKEIQSSFLKSLYFTASRIPAQSHQSFMQMKAVGFTRGNITHTFVSHFQTWLQGSDY